MCALCNAPKKRRIKTAYGPMCRGCLNITYMALRLGVRINLSKSRNEK